MGYYDYYTANYTPRNGRSTQDLLDGMPKVYEWANLEEFIQQFNKPVPKDREPISADKKRLLKGTFRKLRLGWADPAMKAELKKFNELYQFIKATVNSKLPKVEYKPKLVGSRANIAGIVVGDPRTAIGRKQAVDADPKKRSKSNLIRLCCNVDAFYAVTQDYFFIRGAAMCALAEALEAAKYRVEITIAIASIPLQKPMPAKKSDGSEWFGWTSDYGWGTAGSAKDKKTIEAAREKNQRYFVKLKPFNVPVAPLQVAFAMMHPSVLRTLFFAFWKHFLSNETGEQQRWYNDGCGSVGIVPEGIDGTYDIYIAGFDPLNPASTYSDKEGAVKWVLDTLKEFGISTSK